MLKSEVEIDEFFLGGREEGLKGGRQRGKKALVGIAIEVRGHGSGRLRLRVLPDASGPTLLSFTQATTTAGAIVHTDGLQSYRVLSKHGYEHRRHPKQNRCVRSATPSSAPRDLQPQGLDARHAPWRLRRAPTGLSRRVRLPSQPPQHTNGGVPDPPRTRCPAQPHHLSANHPPSRLNLIGANRIRIMRVAP